MPTTNASDAPIPGAPVSGTVDHAGGATTLDSELCRRILATIAELTHQCGRPPTYREVLAALGLHSHRQLSLSINSLVRDGRLQRLSGSRNLIMVAGEPQATSP